MLASSKYLTGIGVRKESRVPESFLGKCFKKASSQGNVSRGWVVKESRKYEGFKIPLLENDLRTHSLCVK